MSPDANDEPRILANLEQLRERIASTAARAGRDPADITLVAVTKTIPVERIRHVVAAGVRDFGENYYQELRDKQASLGSTVRWHFIGRLQSNKARYVAGEVALVHSIDSVRLAQELGRRAAARGAVQDVLLEVRLDPSETKSGVMPQTALDLAAEVAETIGVRLRGLMGMAPFGECPDDARPSFARLRRLFDSLRAEHRHVLSMGMSGDFEVAIEEGSTLVRVGTAIFGRRVAG